MTEKYTLKSENKHPCHRDSTMSKAEIMIIMYCLMGKCGGGSCGLYGVGDSEGMSVSVLGCCSWLEIEEMTLRGWGVPMMQSYA